MTTLAIVLLLLAALVGIAALAVGVAWMRRSARERAQRAARGRKSRAALPSLDPTVATAAAVQQRVPAPAPRLPPAAQAAAAPAAARPLFDLPLLDDEPTQPMMHLDMAPASGWPNTMPASLATMAHQYAETQPADIQKA